MLLALPKDNYGFGVTQFIIPEGSTVIIGKVAEQKSAIWAGGYAVGGGFQVVIPDPSILMEVP